MMFFNEIQASTKSGGDQGGEASLGGQEEEKRCMNQEYACLNANVHAAELGNLLGKARHVTRKRLKPNTTLKAESTAQA